MQNINDVPQQANKEWNAYLELVRSRPEDFRDCAGMEIVLDRDTVVEFEINSGRKIGVLYKSPYSILVVDLVRDANGRLFAYERLLPCVTESAVVCVTKHDGKFVLIKQIRHSLRREQIGFVRGYGEGGHSAQENARKEIAEELGAEVLSIAPLGRVVADSGISGNSVEIFECEIGPWKFKENYEGITDVLTLSDKELTALIADGSIDDGYTLAAFALLKSKKCGANNR